MCAHDKYAYVFFFSRFLLNENVKYGHICTVENIYIQLPLELLGKNKLHSASLAGFPLLYTSPVLSTLVQTVRPNCRAILHLLLLKRVFSQRRRRQHGGTTTATTTTAAAERGGREGGREGGSAGLRV